MKRVSLGLGIGILIGVLASRACKADKLSPEQVLKKSKSNSETRIHY
ncbi:hypothetical protein [Bacillus sp. JCM 19041]